jgi:hypothetical protein
MVRAPNREDAPPSQREALKTVLGNRVVVITEDWASAKPRS